MKSIRLFFWAFERNGLIRQVTFAAPKYIKPQPNGFLAELQPEIAQLIGHLLEGKLLILLVDLLQRGNLG